MKNIKYFKKFNEESQVSELFWESHLLGTLGYLASFGLSYLLFKYMRGESETKSLEKAKQTSSEINNSDEMRNVLIKVIGDGKVQSLLSSYKDRIEKRTITFNEMKSLGEEMKNLLGDILTVDEWNFCDSIIDRLTNEPIEDIDSISDYYTDREKEILKSYNFEEKSGKEFINKELNIKIVKVLSSNNKAYYEFRKDNEEFKKGSLSAIMNQKSELISGHYNNLENCIIGSIKDDQLIDNLYRMIKEHKTMFRRSRKLDIINLLNSIKTKEEMSSLIKDYEEKYNNNLIEIFRDIESQNYGENEWIKRFKELGLI